MSENSGDTLDRAPSETGVRLLDRLARLLALLGGALAVCLALLVSTSITLRAFGLGGVRGDFEFVQMGVALIVFAAMMALIAWRLGAGALDAAKSATTTMVLLLPIAPAIAACAALAGFTALVALAMAMARLRGSA